uniref:Multiple C2 and transmembrane domain containing 2 n=1 Tax=Callorhinchus milii TaxID=7868 RepID=A0A4W3H6V7_CALMI
MEPQKGITAWQSFREKTRPFLPNLRKRKDGKKQLLDQRLSFSEPDMVQVGTANAEDSSNSAVSSSNVTYFSSPSTPLKKPIDNNEQTEPKETANIASEASFHTEMCCSEKFQSTELPVVVKESSKTCAEGTLCNDLCGGTMGEKYEEDLSESTDLESSQSSQIFEEQTCGQNEGKSSDSSSRLIHSPSYLLTINLIEGRNLVIRDRCGTSDPYVKFKLAGKTLFKSRIIYKNLNPRWDETFTVPVRNLNQKLYIKVYDRDLTSDDFMGSAYLSLSDLEVNRFLQKELQLDDPNSLEDYMGVIVLQITLSPKPSESSTNSSFVRLSESFRKSQWCSEVVTISLLAGKVIKEEGVEKLYVKFKLGEERYKSKMVYRSTNPQWRERFDFHLFNEKKNVLEAEVCGTDSKNWEECIGTCKVDLVMLPKGQINHLELPLENEQGSLLLLVTLKVFTGIAISDLCASPLDDVNERKQIIQSYSLRRTFEDLNDIGFLQVQVIKACNLLAADFAGKSDPFCVLELGKHRQQTHTVYKNLNPEWNKIFTFNIGDIHDILEVTIFDEDGDKPPDFLGKVAIPLLSIRNGQQIACVLKNRKLGQRMKGVIYLKLDLVYNLMKASLKTFKPKEHKIQEENLKFSKKMLMRNVRRVRNLTMAVWNTVQYINSCFEWESVQRSVIAFLLYMTIVWILECYMVPFALLMLFAWNYIQLARGKIVSNQYLEDEESDIDDDEDEDEKDLEKKGLIDKIHMVQDIVISGQNILDTIASFGERIKNVFIWSVPFLSKLACFVLAICTIVLYFVPVRYLLLIWGMHKFTKKLRNPYTIDNNELLDFISRVPSDIQKVQYTELRPSNGISPLRKKKSNS